MPPIADFITRNIVPAFEAFAEKIGPVIDFVGTLIGLLQDGVDPMTAFNYAVFNSFPPEVAQRIMEIKDNVVEFVDRVKEFLEPLTDWISKNIEVKDALIAIGIVIGAVILPAIISMISALAPLVLAFAAIVLAVSLVRRASSRKPPSSRAVSLASRDSYR